MKAICYGRAGGGYLCEIEDDDEGGSFPVVEFSAGTARRACMEAAKRLRAVADEFDRLASSPRPTGGYVEQRPAKS